MSKITNDGLTWSDTGCFSTHIASVGVKGRVKRNINMMLLQFIVSSVHILVVMTSGVLLQLNYATALGSPVHAHTSSSCTIPYISYTATHSLSTRRHARRSRLKLLIVRSSRQREGLIPHDSVIVKQELKVQIIL